MSSITNSLTGGNSASTSNKNLKDPLLPSLESDVKHDAECDEIVNAVINGSSNGIGNGSGLNSSSALLNQNQMNLSPQQVKFDKNIHVASPNSTNSTSPGPSSVIEMRGSPINNDTSTNLSVQQSSKTNTSNFNLPGGNSPHTHTQIQTLSQGWDSISCLDRILNTPLEEMKSNDKGKKYCDLINLVPHYKDGDSCERDLDALLGLGDEYWATHGAVSQLFGGSGRVSEDVKNEAKVAIEKKLAEFLRTGNNSSMNQNLHSNSNTNIGKSLKQMRSCKTVSTFNSQHLPPCDETNSAFTKLANRGKRIVFMRTTRLNIQKINIVEESFEAEFWLSFVAPIPTFCLKTVGKGKKPRKSPDAPLVDEEDGENVNPFNNINNSSDSDNDGLDGLKPSDGHEELEVDEQDDTWSKYGGVFPSLETCPIDETLDLLECFFGVTIDWNLWQVVENLEILNSRSFAWDRDGHLGCQYARAGGVGCGPWKRDRVQLDIKFRGTFRESTQLHHFPFDHQTFNVMCELRFNRVFNHPDYVTSGNGNNGINDEDKVKQELDAHFIPLFVTAEDNSLPDWDFFEPLMVVKPRSAHYRTIMFKAPALRNCMHYVKNYYIQLGTLTSLFPLVCFIEVKDVADRLGTMLTLLLTSAALRITLREGLPQVPYDTMLDSYMHESYIATLWATVLCVIPSTRVAVWLMLPLVKLLWFFGLFHHYTDDGEIDDNESEAAALLFDYLWIAIISCHWFFFNAKHMCEAAKVFIGYKNSLGKPVRHTWSTEGQDKFAEGLFGTLPKIENVVDDGSRIPAGYNSNGSLSNTNNNVKSVTNNVTSSVSLKEIKDTFFMFIKHSANGFCHFFQEATQKAEDSINMSRSKSTNSSGGQHNHGSEASNYKELSKHLDRKERMQTMLDLNTEKEMGKDF